MRLNTVLLFALVLLSGVAARADTFTLTGSGINDTFVLPSSPAVSDFGLYGFKIATVPVTENGVASVDQVIFFSSALGGGLLLESPAGDDVNGFGALLYSGASDHPTFVTGTFALSDINSYTLTISSAAVAPEPASLMLLAFALLAGLIWCRRSRRRGDVRH